jgi:hypothetical protein
VDSLARATRAWPLGAWQTIVSPENSLLQRNLPVLRSAQHPLHVSRNYVESGGKRLSHIGRGPKTQRYTVRNTVTGRRLPVDARRRRHRSAAIFSSQRVRQDVVEYRTLFEARFHRWRRWLKHNLLREKHGVLPAHRTGKPATQSPRLLESVTTIGSSIA